MAFIGVHFGVPMKDREDFLFASHSSRNQQRLCFGVGTTGSETCTLSSAVFFMNISVFSVWVYPEERALGCPYLRPDSELMVFAERREEIRKHTKEQAHLQVPAE